MVKGPSVLTFSGAETGGSLEPELQHNSVSNRGETKLGAGRAFKDSRSCHTEIRKGETDHMVAHL